MTTLLIEKTIESSLALKQPHCEFNQTDFASNQTNFGFDQFNIWSSPDSVLATVNNQLVNLPMAKASDLPLTLGSWNAEYLWRAKANHFISSYQQIAKRHHLLALQEVSSTGLSITAAACNYNHFVSSPNSRGQAVGFLVHPRLHITDIHEYSELTEIFGIHDLRPALQIDVFDPQTKITLSVITIHLKSMIGGLAFTSLVRKKQLEKLIGAIRNSKNPTIILGDFNCFIDMSADTEPLLNDGFNITNPHNHTSTQLSGGRLDGMFYKNLSDGLVLKHYNIRNFWRTNLAGRSLSDHGLLTWKLTKNESVAEKSHQ